MREEGDFRGVKQDRKHSLNLVHGRGRQNCLIELLHQFFTNHQEDCLALRLSEGITGVIPKIFLLIS